MEPAFENDNDLSYYFLVFPLEEFFHSAFFYLDATMYACGKELVVRKIFDLIFLLFFSFLL